MAEFQAPRAKIIPQELVHHGDTRIDNYFWLRDRHDPDVIAYLEAENEYTRSVTAGWASLEDELYREMLGHIQETDTGVPYPRQQFLYYRRTEQGKAYALHCRKRGENSEEQVLLDENLLAEGREYFSLGNFEPSPDERFLAYSTDFAGDEVYTIRIRDLSSGTDLADEIPGTYYSLAWTTDNAAVYYVTLDEAKRPYRVWLHHIGGSADTLVYEENDQRFEVEVWRSRDGQFIFIQSESKITSEVRFAPAAHAGAPFRVIWPRRHNVLYDVDSHRDQFYIVTNDEAPEFRVLRCSAANPRRDAAFEFLPAREGITVERLDAFADFLAIRERHRGLPQIRIHFLAEDRTAYVRFEEPAYTLGGAVNERFETNTFRFTYGSLVTPHSVFEYDVAADETRLLKQTPVLGYNPDEYRSERIWAKASDGVEIPISVVYRQGWKRDGQAPMLLYGYGSYGLRSDPAFRSDRLALLDRGFAFAIAHIRGGGDLGRQWYESAKLLSKKRTFTDFIECASHLVNEKYTQASKLAIQGGSAGGLLVGAALNLQPALCNAAVALVPFVDTLTTCLDPTLPLTIGEYEEWGNPQDAAYYRYIKSYSPYDNVKPGPYPHLLITAGLNDPRVSYWEPAKWAAKLRALKTDDHVLLLKTNMGAGHFGPSGRYGYLRELAFIYAFILKTTGESK